MTSTSDQIPNWFPDLIRSIKPWPVIQFKLQFDGLLIEAHHADSMQLTIIPWQSLTREFVTETLAEIQSKLMNELAA